MVNETRWVQMAASRGVASISNVTIRIVKKEGKFNNLCRITIGDNICKKLAWKDGDRIGVFHDTDDQLSWMICKASNGYSLGRPTKNVRFLHTNFHNNIKSLTDLVITELDADIQKDKIIFRIPL